MYRCVCFLFKDKRIALQFGYGAHGTPAIVEDFSYAQWSPHYSAISAISSEGILANGLLKNADERFDTHSFIRFLDEQLLLAMNVFNAENLWSVLVMGENQLICACLYMHVSRGFTDLYYTQNKLCSKQHFFKDIHVKKICSCSVPKDFN